MNEYLSPNNWVVMVNRQGRITYAGKNGFEEKDPMELTTKNLMTADEVLKKAATYKNGTPFDMDKHLLEGAE
ncbi:hypothetical protein pwc_28 [Weissella phage PWc]|nr:hypothetical protein pwc_28 [Weissella phage PWc]